MNLTKTETRTVFNKIKIKKNDIVSVPVIRLKGMFNYEKIKVFGMVNEVHNDYVVVRIAHDGNDFDSVVHVDVQFADEISIIQSSYDVWARK